MSVRPQQAHCCSGQVNTTMYRDPVCGARVSATTRYSHAVAGHTYYFCSDACHQRFSGALPHVANGSLNGPPGTR